MTRRVLGLLVMCALAMVGVAQEEHHAAMPTHPGYAMLSKLAGEWEGPSDFGSMKAVFKITAAGSTVMQTLDPGGQYEMVTMFHGDGAEIMATHFCSGRNQPRMRTVKTNDPKVLRFEFVDGTNLKGSGYINGLQITFVDDDHHIEEWTSVDASGKPTPPLKVQMTRKKS